MSYSILVKVPDPEDIVFIAMPFSQDFKDLQSSIELAVTEIPGKLKPRITEKGPESPSFIRDIVEFTQKARLVVAVCSPESNTGKPNPNVMYELGFAQSIGKATIILTTDEKLLPADIRGQYCVKYQPDEVKTESLRLKIRSKIMEVLDRVHERLIDSSYENISVVHSEHWLHVAPDLWEEFIKVLSFAKRVHSLFQDLDFAFVRTFPGRVREILSEGFSGDAIDKRIAEFEDHWDNYILKYMQTKEDDLRPFDGRWDKIDDAFYKLQSEAERRKMFERSKDYYTLLKKDLTEYFEAHKEAEGKIEGGISRLLKSGGATNFRAVLREMSKKIQTITLHADKLIYNLIDIIVNKKGESHE